VTRDSIPRDDLYGELEVSRQASVAAIEAAYRRLVKQHHPDVARSDDFERIKRLNLAREWLTDLDRRRRYDVSRGMSPTSAIAHHSPNGDDAAAGARRRPRQPTAGSVPDTSAEPARSFGINASEVRIFLAGLRGLDSERARRVFDGRAVAHAKGYTEARRVAAQIGQEQRKTEWQLAREAASVIARGKLGDTRLTEQVVDVLADAAGAIAIRDLLTKTDYRTLMLPWTWKSARTDGTRTAPAAQAGAPGPAGSPKQAPRSPRATNASPAKRPTAAANPAPTATPAASILSAAAPGATLAPTPTAEPPARRVSITDLGVSPWQAAPSEPAPKLSGAARSEAQRSTAIPSVSLPSLSVSSLTPPIVRVPSWAPAAVAIAVFIVVAGALLGIGRPPPEQGVAALTDAPARTSRATAFVVVPGQSIQGTTSEPTATDPRDETPEPPATEGPGGGPGPGETKRPRPSPRPTPEPTPAPTPEPECIVPSLIGETASEAPAIWSAAGFTGLLTFDSPMQPNQRIGYQSLVAGSSEPCSSGIAVRRQG
jgi:hypothetical protein